MYSKILLAFALALNVCVIINANEASDGDHKVMSYEITVKTADKKFSSHDGKLKLAITINDTLKITQEEFVLTPTDVKLKQDKTYTATITSSAPLITITSVYLRWTLASPYNPVYAVKKPSIYFDPITVSHAYVDPNTHISVTASAKFCPSTIPVAIKHGEGATFNVCTNAK